MATYQIKAPDGKTYRITGPDGATHDQVRAAVLQQFPEAAHAPKAPAKPRNGGTGIGFLDSFLSSGNELLQGVVEGAYNAASAVTDPIAEGVLNIVNGDDSGTKALEAANRTRKDVSDAVNRTFVSKPNPLARTAGQVAASLAVPLPKVSALGRFAPIVVRAAQGAVGGAAVRDVGSDASAPAAVGAAANVVLPPVLSRIASSKPVQAVTSRIASALPRAAEVAPALEDRPLAALGAEAEQRAADFKSLGIDNPTTGMLTREPNTFSFERNIAPVQGVGDNLQQQILDVERSLVDKGREIVDNLGGAKSPEATGKAVQDVLDTKRAEMQQVTSKLYDEVRETRGNEAVGRLNNLRERMTDPDMVDNAVFDTMREGITRRMERLGLIGKGGSLSKPVTLNQAEELRKFIGGLGSSTEPGVRRMRRVLIDALDDDVVEAVGDDAFKEARASAKARFDEFQKTFAGRIADEGIPPERLTKRIIGDTASLDDVRALKQSLTNGTEEQVARGTEALQGLKARAIEDLLGTSSDSEGRLLGGTLERNFLKQQDKLRELLDRNDFDLLRRLVIASRNATVAPPGSAVNRSATAITQANLFQALKPKVRESWLKFLAKNAATHTAAWLAAGAPANLALGAAQAVMHAKAESRAAGELLKRVQLASNPAEAAAAIKAMQSAAKSDPSVKKLLDSLGLGGAAASVAEEE